MKTEIIKKIMTANIIALALFLGLGFVYDLLYRNYFPHEYMKWPEGNYFFIFAMPAIIFALNWRMLKETKTHIRVLASIVCMLVGTIAFNFLITMLNIDGPFSFGPGGGLLAI